MTVGGGKFELALDAVQAGRQRGRHRQVRIDVGAGEPQLDARRFGGSPGIARIAVVRLSTPQVALTGAQAPGTVRLYELMVGQKMAVSSGRFATRPAMYCCIRSDMPPASSVKEVPVLLRVPQALMQMAARSGQRRRSTWP